MCIRDRVSEEVCEAAGDECDEEIGEELREHVVEDGSEAVSYTHLCLYVYIYFSYVYLC